MIDKDWPDTTTTTGVPFELPALSKWECHLFGDSNGIVWTPRLGHEPNWFWRKMQFLFFGNRWIFKG